MKNWFFKNRKMMLGLGIFFCLFFISQTTFAATYYWVGAAGSNVNVGSNWSTASGGAGGTIVPGSADSVIFDGGGNNNATISANWTVSTVSITSGYTQIITQNSGTIWTINSTFTNSSTASVFTSSGTTTLDHTSRSPSITTGGITFNNLVLYSAETCSQNLTTTFLDSFAVSGNFVVQRAGGCDSTHTWSASTPININISGNFSITSILGPTVLGNVNTSINMIGDNKTFFISGGTYNANFNFNGTGTTTVSKGGGTSAGTTTINQSTGVVALNGGSNFYNLVINSGKTIDASPNGGINSYNLTVYNNFVNSAGSAGFVAREGTFTFDHTSRSPSITTGGIYFNNLVLYSTETCSQTLITTFLDSFTINGTFSVQRAGGCDSTHTWSATSPITITVTGNFSVSSVLGPTVIGNTNISINMTGDNKSFSLSGGTFNANLNFNGTGTTTVSKGGASTAGTTVINQASGSVVLGANSVFFNLNINNGKTLDVGANSYNLTIKNSMINQAGAIFIYQNGTVIFDHTDRSPTITTGGVIFNNLNLTSADGNLYTTSFTDSFTVNGNLIAQTTTGYKDYRHTWSATNPITITLLGNFNMAAAGTWPSLTNVTFGNSNMTLNMTGANKSFTIPAYTTILPFNANLNFNGTGTTTVSKGDTSVSGTTTINQLASPVVFTASSTFYNLVLNNGTTTLANLYALTTYGYLTINSDGILQTAGAPLIVTGIMTVNGKLQLNGSNLTVTGNFNVNAAGIFQLFGNETVSKCPTSVTGATVSYNGISASYTLKNCTYSKLSIDGGGSSVFLVPASLPSVGTTTINSGNLSLNGNNFNTTSLINNSTIRMIGTELITYSTSTSSGTIEYVGDSDGLADTYIIGNYNYNNIKVNPTDSLDIFRNNGPTSLIFTKQNSGNYVMNVGTGFDNTYAGFSSAVLKENGIYKMWYSGYNGSVWGGFGYATSSDGIIWTKYSTTPIFGLGAAGKFDAVHVLDPAVINDNGTYKMWYSGYSATLGWNGIGYATSPDGITWTRQNSGNAVLGLNTNPAAFDKTAIYGSSIIKVGSIYHMWYTGQSTLGKIGYATSSDGITWNKYSINAVLVGTVGKFDSSQVFYPNVVFDGTNFNMFYVGHNGTIWGGIGYAISPDGINWTKQNSGNAIVTNGTGFDVNAIYTPVAIKVGNQYKVWYTGYNGYGRTGLAATSDYSSPLNASGLNITNGSYIFASTTNLSGSLIHNGGTLSATTTILNLVGNDQTISLSATTTFASLNKTLGVGSTTPQTLTFGSTSTSPLIITGTTTLIGLSGADNLLKLRSVASGTQWYFDPQGVRNFSYLDVQDSNNISTTTIRTANISGYVDSGNNTGWVSSQPVLSVEKSGNQIATTTIPASGFNLGGAFTLNTTGGALDVNSIRIKQVGSLSTSTLSNIQLFYKTEATCSSTKPTDATLFGSMGSFDSLNIATTTGTITLSEGFQTCLYITYDLPGTYSSSTLGRSIDFEITNPSIDIIVNGGTVSTTDPVNISGRTIVTTTDITSLLSLRMNDPSKDPTLFYLQNGAVWKKEGYNNSVRLTSPNLLVQNLTFTNFTPISGGTGSVRIQMTVSNVNLGADPSFQDVTRTYSTTATIRAWQGSN